MAKISINIQSGNIEKKANDEIIVGIDLGTTHSLVAYINEGNPKAVADQSGKNTLVPSIIHFTEEGEIIVGEAAKAYLISNPERTIYSVKRLMGKSFNDIQNGGKNLGYRIIDEDEEQLVKINVDNKYYSPIELSAEILKKLKSRIEDELNQPISKAVITVPAYFNDTQRQATRDAGKLAGLDVLRIVNEPTAASLAYGLGIEEDAEMKIAVYDLGGGTFDVSILEINHGVFEVLSTNGDTYLGGDDFDEAIINYWIEKFNIPKSQLNNKSTYQSLRLEAEQAKKSLSCQNLYSCEIGDLRLSISRSAFEKLIQPLVNKTVDSCRMALKDANLGIDDIDHIIMVGGSTRVPLVKNSIGQFFNKKVNDSLNPDEVVALGAAVQADILSGNRRSILLLDVTPLSLGIETVGGLMDTIIPRNSKVPIKQARNYTTSIDGQTNLKVAVYQGERDLVEDNRKLGEFILRGIPPMPAGVPKIQVQFILDADGILTVKALEERSGKETQVEIRSQYGITEEEMAKMLIDSLQNANTDMVKRSLIEAQTEAQNIILAGEKFVVQNKDILTDEEVTYTKNLLEKLKSTLHSKDKNYIQSAMDTLNLYTKPLAQRAMESTINKALKGTEIK
jgi:molecular chaperone HscA